MKKLALVLGLSLLLIGMGIELYIMNWLGREIEEINDRVGMQEVRIMAVEKQVPQITKYLQVVNLLSEKTEGRLSAREIVEISRMIIESCYLYRDLGLTEAMIFGLIERESNFDPNAVSPAKAYGLMQLLLPTATPHLEKLGFKNITVDLLMDPVINIKVGIAELVRLRKYWLSEGIDSWYIVFTSYYWGVRATSLLLVEKGRGLLPSLEYGKGVMELQKKWIERGL